MPDSLSRRHGNAHAHPQILRSRLRWLVEIGGVAVTSLFDVDTLRRWGRYPPGLDIDFGFITWDSEDFGAFLGVNLT